MKEKSFAVVGSFSMTPPYSHGLSVYSYDKKNGSLDFIGRFFEDINVGQQYYSAKNNVLYINNEIRSRRGKAGGGGYLTALSVNQATGELQLINEKETLCPMPSWVNLDGTGRFAVVPHFGTDNFVTKCIRYEDGNFESKTEFDDIFLALFRIEESGGIGELCDIDIHPGKDILDIHINPHLHSAQSDPSGELFLVCDLGMDKIYSYKIDHEAGKLIRKCEHFVEKGAGPRYSVFHPVFPIVYCNNEGLPVVHSYGYDISTGLLEKRRRVSILADKTEKELCVKPQPSDIVIHPEAKNLYIAIRGINLIAAFKIEKDGDITLIQNINCDGDNPRGLCISPDGSFLFSMNNKSEDISVFSIGEDGILKKTEKGIKAKKPGNMKILTFPDYTGDLNG
jgi:6-phosphogluconolactonase (cycloisomerase 2 family)